MSGDEARALRRKVRFRHAFVWLLVGTTAYAVALAIVILLYPDPKDVLAPVIGPSLYLTPLFGLPYLFASARQRGWKRRILYFVAVLPLADVLPQAPACPAPQVDRCSRPKAVCRADRQGFRRRPSPPRSVRQGCASSPPVLAASAGPPAPP